jgi:hypothetical protein
MDKKNYTLIVSNGDREEQTRTIMSTRHTKDILQGVAWRFLDIVIEENRLWAYDDVIGDLEDNDYIDPFIIDIIFVCAFYLEPIHKWWTTFTLLDRDPLGLLLHEPISLPEPKFAYIELNRIDDTAGSRSK